MFGIAVLLTETTPNRQPSRFWIPGVGSGAPGYDAVSDPIDLSADWLVIARARLYNSSLVTTLPA